MKLGLIKIFCKIDQLVSKYNYVIGSSNNGNGGYSPGANNLGNVGSLSVIRPDEDVILALGTEALCDDLELKPDDFRILIFAWKCNAEQVVNR